MEYVVEKAKVWLSYGTTITDFGSTVTFSDTNEDSTAVLSDAIEGAGELRGYIFLSCPM